MTGRGRSERTPRPIAGAPTADNARSRADLLRVLLYVLIAAGVYVLLLLFWHIREALLLAFTSVIMAVVLSRASEFASRATGLPDRWSIVLVGVALLLIVGLLAWLIGAQIQSQISELSSRLPQAVQDFEQRFGLSLFTENDREGGAPQSGPRLQGLVEQAASFVPTVAGALSGLVLVVVGGFFLAADPHLYRAGFVKLFPKSQHARVEETLTDCGRALRMWLAAQLVAMTIVGMLVGIGTWLIGLPAPLGLGLFAALTEFVPVVGPVIGAVPALLLALSQGGTAFLWTLLLFLGIQQLESNVIAPLVQRRMVDIPPALLLFAVLAVGLVFGILGVMIAAPLAVVLYVAIKKLYVRQMLGEETSIPGEQ